MTPPDELRSDQPLIWSTGRGTDVWALFCACAAGDLESARQLLDRDPALVRSHFAYRTPLYFAVRENRLPVVSLLLERGADPLSLAVNDTLVRIAIDRGYRQMESLLRSWLRDRCNASPAGEPLARAIRDGDIPRILARLDAAPELIHTGDERSNQPIHWAVMTRQPEVIDLLLAREADINARRFDGARPIHLTNGDYHFRGWRDVPSTAPASPDEVYRHLVERGAEVPLGMACAKGDLGRVQAILNRDPAEANRVSDYGSYYVGCGAPLKNAAAAGQLEIVELLLRCGADPNLPEEGIAPHGHALYAAVANGHREIARLLLEHGAHPNPEVESSADALSRAIDRGDQAMIDLLCRHGAARGVHLLAYDNDLRTAAAVFAANPALADDPEALANAASEDFVRLLLRHAPRLPTRISVAKDRPTAELLFQHGMDANRADWLGGTPLHDLARRGDVDAAGQFLDHGADLHARDEDLQSSPLACAAKFNRPLMVEFLLRRGARLRLPDDPPWATPLAWARRRGHTEIAALLEQAARWGTLPPRFPIAVMEQAAADLVEAVRSGNATACERLKRVLDLDRTPSPEDLRSWSRERLRSSDRQEDPDHADARSLVARRYGHSSWEELQRHFESQAKAAECIPIWAAAEEAVVQGDEARLARMLAEHAVCLRNLPARPYAPCGPAPQYQGDARGIIAREQQFEDWSAWERHAEARRTPGSPTARFEDAVDAVVAGNLDALEAVLAADPSLVKARSDRVHRCTLLHYVGANGVEGYRQRTPGNAVEVTGLLLRAGAEVDAWCPLYGGSTVLGLVATSIHPLLAGLQQALMESLLAAGASLNRRQGSGEGRSIVAGCLANGRGEAARFLARSGAALDVATASGTGQVQALCDLIGERDAQPVALSPHAAEGWCWACQYGELEVVREWIRRGLDVGTAHGGQTGLHWAAYGGHVELVDLLLSEGAPVTATDGKWGHTPLGWAIYGWNNPPVGARLQRYPEVIRRLVNAGAPVKPAWLEDPVLTADPSMIAALRGCPGLVPRLRDQRQNPPPQHLTHS